MFYALLGPGLLLFEAEYIISCITTNVGFELLKFGNPDKQVNLSSFPKQIDRNKFR